MSTYTILLYIETLLDSGLPVGPPYFPQAPWHRQVYLSFDNLIILEWTIYYSEFFFFFLFESLKNRTCIECSTCMCVCVCVCVFELVFLGPGEVDDVVTGSPTAQ
jgi:hypothetical protein